MSQAWCVRCRKKVNVDKPREDLIQVRNKPRKFLRGICGICGTKVSIILKMMNNKEIAKPDIEREYIVREEIKPIKDRIVDYIRICDNGVRHGGCGIPISDILNQYPQANELMINELVREGKLYSKEKHFYKVMSNNHTRKSFWRWLLRRKP